MAGQEHGWPPVVDQMDVQVGRRLVFDPELTEAQVELEEDNACASLRDMYQSGTVWLHGTMRSCRAGKNWNAGWRELQVVLTSSRRQTNGQRLTGGLTVVLSRALPLKQGADLALPADQTPDACGFTMHFLPRLLSIWSTAKAEPTSQPSHATRLQSGLGVTRLPAGSQPRGNHIAVDIRHGDMIRVLVHQEGWCDIVGCLEANLRKWRKIVGWQTPFRGEPLYMGVGLRHTTMATLRRVYHGMDEGAPKRDEGEV